MNVVLHEQPIAASCWKLPIALDERQVPYDGANR